MSQFYEIDSTKFSHREYWWGSKSPLVLIAWLIKWLRIRIPGSTDDPNTESTLPFVVEKLPPEIEPAFAPFLTELKSLGFGDPLYHLIHDPGTRTNIYWATLHHESRQCFARIHQRVWQQTQQSDRGVFPMFITEFTDGTFFVSSAGKPDTASPTSVAMNRKYRAKTAALWESHQQRALDLTLQKSIVPAGTREELIAATERLHVKLRDFHLGRGVFRPRTTEEQAKADKFAAAVSQAQSTGLAEAEVVAEMEKLQEQKPGWSNAFWILAASILLFLAAGAAQWDWKFTLWLIPVLLLHEGGHWLAMRIFKYRNLRMFFIPLFGAAVTGQHWNVPGWKKAIVSLAGPLPGIVLGAGLAVLAVIFGTPWLNQAALIFLLVNGFNLLPVLPLDGGHVLHATLFCRNRWLDITFRLLAVAGLAGLSALGLGKIFLFLAIIMGISLPVAVKIGKVTDELRKSPPPPPLPGEDRIPPAAAQTIIAAVRNTMPKGTSNKILAQQALNVFETLNARPPGVLATAGLLLCHAGGIIALVLFGALLVIGKHGNLGDFFDAAAGQPENAFHCGEIQSWPDEVAADAAKPTAMLITTFENHAQARAGFQSLTNELPTYGQLTVVGSSLLLRLPAENDAAREMWFDKLQTLSTNLFVTVSNRSATVIFSFLAPTAEAATNIARELDEYLDVTTGMHLIPPWSPAAQEPGFELKLQARRDWALIGRELAARWDDPALESIDTRIATATRRGASAEAKRLADERENLSKELEAQALERLRTSPNNRIDQELLDLHVEVNKLEYTNRVERSALMRKIAAKLGEEGHVSNATHSARYGVTFGSASKHGLMIRANWLSFRDATVGIPAFTAWLCAKQCTNIRYQFMFGSSALGAMLDEDLEPESE